ncbi:MAG: phage/plasmid primase, P4 family [Patescibacteria group bacterium]|nr:phage/plasmid primase, P4 family [Patescibacteria group bacterium]
MLKYEKKEKEFKIVKITDKLINKYKIKTVGEKDIEFFIYKKGLYSKDKRLLQKEIEEEYQDECTTHKVKEIINKISRKTYIPREDFDKIDPNIICVKNGALNLSTLELKEHNADYNFTTQIPITYNKEKKCPLFFKFLEETLDKQYIILIQEFMGMCLFRQYYPKKAFIFVGETNTGKTTLISILEKFISSEEDREKNISGLNLQKIATDKFSTINLYKKYVNIHDDMSEKDISDTGNFKMLTGAGTFDGEYKFGDHFKFKNYAKLLFACNTIPAVKEIGDDNAYFERWVIIPFENIIQKKILLREEKIINNQNEMSGILNWALEGFKRVIENSQYSYNKTNKEIKETMIKYNKKNSIANFAIDNLIEKTGEWIKKEELYKHYQNYASKNELPIETKKKFGTNFRKYANYVAEIRKEGDDVWGNVVVISDIKEEDYNEEDYNEEIDVIEEALKNKTLFTN